MNDKNNYFSLFGFSPAFDIDTAELTSRYRELQKKLHPDKYATAGAKERAAAMQQATIVNDAYNTLKNPLLRARYLLELQGMDLAQEDNTVMDPGFLMQQMELREMLEEAKSAADPLAALDALADELVKQKQQILARLQEIFAAAALDVNSAAANVRKLQFLSRLEEEVDNQYTHFENL